MSGLGVRFVAMLVFSLAISLVACSGGDDTDGPSSTPVTPSLPSGTPPAAGKPLSDIFSEPISGLVQPEVVKAAYAAAYKTHPDAGLVPSLEGGEAFPEQFADNNFNVCLFGQPTLGSAPAIRGGGCQILTYGLLAIYATTGYGEFYQAAVVAWDFAVSTLPPQAEPMHNSLQILFDRRASSGL